MSAPASIKSVTISVHPPIDVMIKAVAPSYRQKEYIKTKVLTTVSNNALPLPAYSYLHPHQPVD